ncbi:undecaprenyl-phosphate glucose phosphotransferase [Bradyrhizobium betae]|uniref:Undecaprenyl-phosphate glucose phosphotransferase n=1 Tax=Bradyrhizobium betae TaxID=244734 RepID=A0A5P6PCU5_9BRAD|nr:undecaprenyl-phosphate glucose phosphotransferase [Bradyrhizobium betae]MCS3730584.1 undecaprenyl-phosphate galactose phosphotransferase/putative colanic acid biosynthesis UDP-glucose lipid carrier transferase [Bradyrhizobium betae]QFI76105.1 undecaprenyl-phosphate glucose phosphotransferase [Bradyrhizobium betae]
MTDLTNAGETTSAFASRSRVRLAIPFGLIEPLFAALDCAIIVAAGAIGGIAYQRALGGSAEDASFYAGLGLVASLAYVLVAHFLGLYRLNRLLDDERDGGRVWAGWCLAALVLAVVLFLFKSGGDTSRGSVVCFFAIGGAGLLVARRLGKRGLRSALVAGTIRGRRAVVIGTQGELAQFSKAGLLARLGLHEVDRITLPRDEVTKFNPSGAKQRDDALMKRIREASAEEIVLAVSWAGPQDIEALLERLRVIPLPVRLLPDRAVSTVLRHQTSIQQRLYMVEVQPAPLSTFDRLTKRLLDIVVAATSLALLTPPLILAALAIKLESKGPVIFQQRRNGFNGKPFVIYKLRSMRVQEDGGSVVQATKEDPRVTRVGRLLRQTSIDELPQLFNVLQGHMSIVGPRPHALVHDYEYGAMIANYAFRHHVKPGITGWAQVHGYRGATPQLELMKQRVNLDLWYIDNWSLILDIHIMFRTAFELIRPRNAY